MHEWRNLLDPFHSPTYTPHFSYDMIMNGTCHCVESLREASGYMKRKDDYCFVT